MTFEISPAEPKTCHVGQIFGRWTLEAFGKRPGSREIYAVARCSCGSPRKLVKLKNIQQGKSLSCGCLRTERTSCHGLSDHPLYRRWRNMLNRCYDTDDKDWPNYGGRGITVCARWHHVEAFVADMAESYYPGLEIDREDNDGPYEPGNCRWATDKQQAANKRTNRVIAVGGEHRVVAEWARRAGVTRTTVLDRLDRGWDPEKAATSRARYNGRTSE